MSPNLDHGSRLDQSRYLLPALAVELETFDEVQVLLPRPSTRDIVYK